MARPRRCGLDWFPLDTELDDKISFVEATHGIKGFAIVVKLYQKIYGENGYFCQWNARACTIFATELRLSVSAVQGVIATCVEEGIFDAFMLNEHGILTSAGIQRRYLAAARKRTDFSIKAEYALAEPALNFQSAEETPVSAPKTPISSVQSTQSKSTENNNKTIEPSTIEVAIAIQENADLVELTYHEAFALAQRFITYNQLQGWTYLDRWRDALRLFMVHEREKREEQDKRDEAKIDAWCASHIAAKEVHC